MEVKINHGTLDDIDYPKVLYKYRNWNNLYDKKYITERTVYLASPDQFEDPLDCKIPISYESMTKEEAFRYFEHLFINGKPHLTPQRIKKEAKYLVRNGEWKNPKKMAKHRNFYFKEYFERLGVLSLTAENCLEAMWSKYANQSKGFCIGYNSRVLFESLSGGGKVEYYENIPVLKPYPIMERQLIHHYQIYHKEKKWEFEREYRTEKFWINPASIEERNIKIPKEAFHSVILGKKMYESDREEILNEIQNNLGEIQIIEQSDLCN